LEQITGAVIAFTKLLVYFERIVGEFKLTA
jgi:hypothetical protein